MQLSGTPKACHYYLGGISRSRVESNLHTTQVFLSVSKIGYRLIMCSPKFCSCIKMFSTVFCTLFFTPTVLESIFYCNNQNFIHFYAFLAQITAFGFAQVSCLRVSKKFPHWFWNRTDDSTLWSPDFYRLFK